MLRAALRTGVKVGAGIGAASGVANSSFSFLRDVEKYNKGALSKSEFQIQSMQNYAATIPNPIVQAMLNTEKLYTLYEKDPAKLTAGEIVTAVSASCPVDVAAIGECGANLFGVANWFLETSNLTTQAKAGGMTGGHWWAAQSALNVKHLGLTGDAPT
jgi:hypothetical protein